jgi:hypothetical protein
VAIFLLGKSSSRLSANRKTLNFRGVVEGIKSSTTPTGEAEKSHFSFRTGANNADLYLYISYKGVRELDPYGRLAKNNRQKGGNFSEKVLILEVSKKYPF